MNLEQEDKEILLDVISNGVRKIPGPLRGLFLKPLPEYTSQVPPSLLRYTLRDIVAYLEEAWEDGQIRW